jgi:hypothetical protein
MNAILRELFGPGTWGTAGNLVASAMLTVPTVVITHVRSYRQRERQHQEMKNHVSKTIRG